jgi:hypothetical protein
MKGINPAFQGEFIHGPCYGYKFLSMEFDVAMCFYSHHWPVTALPWIERCLNRTWPSQGVLQTILDEGSHLVPIQHKEINENSDLEWRISFAKAEQKLVYSMNHCQFI